MLTASRQDLRSVIADDRVVGHLQAIGVTLTAALLQRAVDRPLFDTSDALLDYLWFDQGQAPVERFRVLFIGATNQLLRDVTLAVGDVDAAAVPIREIIRIAIDAGATGLLLVHNHPSGDPTPSHQDVAVTRRIARAAALFDIAIVDHVIVSRIGWKSLRAEALMTAPAETVFVPPEPPGSALRGS